MLPRLDVSDFAGEDFDEDDVPPVAAGAGVVLPVVPTVSPGTIGDAFVNMYFVSAISTVAVLPLLSVWTVAEGLDALSAGCTALSAGCTQPTIVTCALATDEEF